MKSDFEVKKVFNNFNLVHYGKEKLMKEKTIEQSIVISNKLITEHSEEIINHKFKIQKFDKSQKNIYIRSMVDHKTNVIYYDEQMIKRLSDRTEVPQNLIRKMMAFHEVCHIVIKKNKLLKGLGFYQKRAAEEVICSYVAKKLAESERDLIEIDLISMKGK